MAEPIDVTRIERLIQAVRAGEASAANDLGRILEPYLRRLAGRRMGERARRWGESGDVVQQVLLEVVAAPGAVEESLEADELLGRLARRVEWRVADLVRRRRREVGASALDAREPSPPQPSEGVVTRDDERELVRRLVERLPEPWASTVRLCALEGLTYVAAASRLGVSEDTVRKRYSRAREILARELRSAGDRE